MKIRFFLVLGRWNPIDKRCRPAYRQAGLNLSTLAYLLLRSVIPMDLYHGKKDAYPMVFLTFKKFKNGVYYKPSLMVGTPTKGGWIAFFIKEGKALG